MVSRKGSDESASSCSFVYHDSLAVAVPLADVSLLAAVAAAESCLNVRGDGPRVYHSFL